MKTTQMDATVRAEIENCKTMAAVAFDLETRAAVVAKWAALCDTLHSLGLSVAMFEGPSELPLAPLYAGPVQASHETAYGYTVTLSTPVTVY